MTLDARDFPAFYQEVHGRSPFPWQADIVARVLADGVWPDVVDVPTGMGKTSMLDVALFLTAATAGVRGRDRLGRRRIFFVVDRRLVVDEAWEHARRLASALDRADGAGADGVVGAVVRALRSLTGQRPERRPVVRVTRMRGGATWAASWLDRPDELGLVVGTVDQIGSRMLFRGYGVGDRRKPIDAALTGMDSLVLVDEAHLAEALVSTLHEAQQRDRQGLDLPRATVVRLSATPGADRPPSTFSINPEAHRPDPETRGNDPDAGRAREEAWRRLSARKRLNLVETTAAKADQTLASLAASFASTSDHRAVLVVCNTVDRARSVHERLTTSGKGGVDAGDAQVWLLTGRSREVDRQQVVNDAVARLGVDRNREGDNRPAIVVATQTVEVGANLDADVLITESASWDALVQRLGRLNRLGRHSSDAYAVVVHDGIEEGPVYGRARDVTWAMLCGLHPQAPARNLAELDTGSGPDVGPLSCTRISQNVPREALSERPVVPLLQTATLDAWTQTGPVPLCDPPTDPFLHGIDTGRAEVLVAWRDGLVPSEDSSALVGEAQADALLTALPVRAEEQIAVPFGAMRRWMSGQTPGSVDDLEASPEDLGRAKDVHEPFHVLAWRADERLDQTGTTARNWRWIDAAELRPSDTVVVPTARGGIDQYGWNPSSTATATDVLERAALQRRRPVVRLDEKIDHRWELTEGPRRRLADLTGELRRAPHLGPEDWSQLEGQFRVALHEAVAANGDDGSGDLIRWLDTGEPRLLPVPSNPEQPDGGTQLWLLKGGRVPEPEHVERSSAMESAAPDELEDDDPLGSSVGRQVTLSRHHENVGSRAADIATALGLPEALVRILEQAARWHDMGKVEERFQASLHGGDAVAALIADEPLAKSGMPTEDRAAWSRARRLARLPRGARHEAWSAALVQEYLAQTDEWDADAADLLVHLVAAHHGHARPWLPAVADGEPRKVTARFGSVEVSIPSQDTVAFDHPARFCRLNAAYGRWGLALLESIVRCADMTVSGEGS